jgi:hypothetical protein
LLWQIQAKHRTTNFWSSQWISDNGTWKFYEHFWSKLRCYSLPYLFYRYFKPVIWQPFLFSPLNWTHNCCRV